MKLRASLVATLLAIVYSLQPNYDLTLSSKYPLGDKPIVTGACTNGWECAHIGTSSGEITTTSATTIGFSTAGVQDTASYEFAYQTFTSGDVQICATVPDQSTWTGYHENFTGFGVKITEGLLIPDYFSQMWNPYLSDIVRHKIGTLLVNSTSQGDPLTAGPEMVCETFDDTLDEWRGWQSDDGSNFTQVGATTVHTPAGTLYAGAFGVSQESGQTSVAILTDVVASSTITVYSTGNPPAFSAAPTVISLANTTADITFTLTQDGTVYGVACPNGQATAPTITQIKAGACGAAGVVDAFSQVVVAGVADADQFTGLTAATTYDFYFAANNATNGDNNAPFPIANQITSTGTIGTCASALPGPTNATMSSGLFLTADVDCRKANDIVAGWDFSLPAETPIAARGGFFSGGSAGAKPAYFTGNRLYECNFAWYELEPTNDSWTAGEALVDACLANHTGFTGAWLNIRGSQVTIRDCANTTDKFTSEWNAPSWVRTAFSAHLLTQSCNQPGDFQIRSLNFGDDTFVPGGGIASAHDEYIEFVQHYADYIAAHHSTKNFWQAIHIGSQSRGEECCISGLTNQQATIFEVINLWADTYGAINAGLRSRLAWMNLADPYYAEGVTNNGTGLRGGIIERFLQGEYTPGTRAGITLDANGYMTVSPLFEPISQLRHYMDENEECGSTSKFGGATYKPICYMESMLRMLQMYRNVAWADAFTTNGRLDNFFSQEAGHTPATQPDGWAQLVEMRGVASGSPVTLKNLERGIGQRETLGATTVTNKSLIGYNPVNSGTNNPPVTSASCNFGGDTNCYAMTLSRRGASIGFFVDDAFWATSLTQNAVFKLTYISTADKTITVKKGATTLCTISAIGSTVVRTATCFVANFNPSASGVAEDFSVDSDGTVDLMFVRLIKDGGVGAVWGGSTGSPRNEIVELDAETGAFQARNTVINGVYKDAVRLAVLRPRATFTISNISKAAQAVMTWSGADPVLTNTAASGNNSVTNFAGITVGSVTGMTQMSNRLVRCDPATVDTGANTCTLLQDGNDDQSSDANQVLGDNHINSSGYGVFSGTATATMWEEAAYDTNGSLPPTSTIDVRVEDTVTPPSNINGAASAFFPRSGSYFFYTDINRTYDYSAINGQTAKNKPRYTFFLNSQNGGLADYVYNTEACFAGSVGLPSNYDSNDITTFDSTADQVFRMAQADAQDEAAWTIQITGGSGGVDHWYLTIDRGTHDQNGTTGELNVDLGAVTPGIGKYTDWLVKYKLNITNGYIEVWNRIADNTSSLVKNETAWTQVYSRTGAGVGHINPVAGESTPEADFRLGVRSYKYGWNHNASTTPSLDIFKALDEIRLTRFVVDGGDCSDVTVDRSDPT